MWHICQTGSLQQVETWLKEQGTGFEAKYYSMPDRAKTDLTLRMPGMWCSQLSDVSLSDSQTLRRDHNVWQGVEMEPGTWSTRPVRYVQPHMEVVSLGAGREVTLARGLHSKLVLNPETRTLCTSVSPTLFKNTFWRDHLCRKTYRQKKPDL